MDKGLARGAQATPLSQAPASVHGLGAHHCAHVLLLDGAICHRHPSPAHSLHERAKFSGSPHGGVEPGPMVPLRNVRLPEVGAPQPGGSQALPVLAQLDWPFRRAAFEGFQEWSSCQPWFGLGR